MGRRVALAVRARKLGRAHASFAPRTLSNPSNPMLKLVISDNEGTTTVVLLVRDEISIGRKDGNTIRLTESATSRAGTARWSASTACTACAITAV